MADQWLTVKFEGETALGQDLVLTIRQFLENHGIGEYYVKQDELPGKDDSTAHFAGLANNETTIGPLG